MGFVDGILAATFAPLILIIGFVLWDKIWTASAIMLNITKSSVAALLFILVAIFQSFVFFWRDWLLLGFQLHDFSGFLIVDLVNIIHQCLFMALETKVWNIKIRTDNCVQHDATTKCLCTIT